MEEENAVMDAKKNKITTNKHTAYEKRCIKQKSKGLCDKKNVILDTAFSNIVPTSLKLSIEEQKCCVTPTAVKWYELTLNFL